MKIYRPILTNFKAQAFGQNNACARLNEDGNPILPYQVISIPVKNTCPVGYTSFYTAALGMLGHNGEDWSAYHGEPIYFPVDAPGINWQAATEVDKDGGIGVRVRSTTPVALENLPPQAKGSLNMIQGQYELFGGAVYLEFLFWHLEKVNVYDKQPIKLGDMLGWADSTGASSGDHVHFSMKVSSNSSWFTLDGDNGYQGALDFDQWFVNEFVLDMIPPVKMQYAFNTTMTYGQNGQDIKNMQEVLKADGSFPANVNTTGFFGDITAGALLAARTKHNISSASDPKGHSAGPLTRAMILQIQHDL